MSKYINAEKFLQAHIKRCNNYPPIIGTCSMDNVTLESEIMSFPIADVAPIKHGDWITWAEAGNWIPSENRHECSQCHDVAQVLINSVELLSEYCPNCGAKMDRGSNIDDDFDWENE